MEEKTDICAETCDTNLIFFENDYSETIINIYDFDLPCSPGNPTTPLSPTAPGSEIPGAPGSPFNPGSPGGPGIVPPFGPVYKESVFAQFHKCNFQSIFRKKIFNF